MKKSQTIFFGANDAVLEGGPQHVPLDRYKECLKAIILHPLVQAQCPKILLLTPPPVNEYQLEPDGSSTVDDQTRRVAATTKLYADGCMDVGKSLNIPVVDIWGAFMTAVGWVEGEPLIGSKDAPRSEILQSLLSDGTCIFFKCPNFCPTSTKFLHTIRVFATSYSHSSHPESAILYHPSSSHLT